MAEPSSLQPNLTDPNSQTFQQNQLFLRPGESPTAYASRVGLEGYKAPTAQPLNTGSGFNPPTVPVSVSPTPSIDSSLLTGTPTTMSDIRTLLSENRKRRDEYVASLNPTQDETTLQNSLADLRKQADDFSLSLAQGQKAQYGLGRPLELSTGRAQQMADNAQFQIANYGNQEKNLLTRLGIAQAQADSKRKGLEAALSFDQQDMDTMFKVQDTMFKEQQMVLERAKQLSDSSRNTLALMIEKFQGLDFENLNPQTQLQLAQLAAQAQIPLDVLMQGMKVQKDQVMFDRQMKQAEVTGLYGLNMPSTPGYDPSYDSPTSTPTDAQAILHAIRTVESGGNVNAKGASGESGAFQIMPATWVQYSNEYLKSIGQSGYDLARTPQNEERVAQFKIQSWLDEGYTPQQIASMWNAGEGRPNAYAENFKGTNSKGVSYDTPGYVNKVMAALGQTAPGLPNASASQYPPIVSAYGNQIISGSATISSVPAALRNAVSMYVADQGGVDNSDDLMAFARDWFVSGKRPSGIPKGKVGEVERLIKEVPKSPGMVIEATTGTKPEDQKLADGYAAMYDIIKKTNELKTQFKQGQTGLVVGPLSYLNPFGGDTATYLRAKKEIVDLLARARTGAAMTTDEEAFYSKMLPGMLNRSLGLGPKGDSMIADFEKKIDQLLQTKLAGQGWQIVGYNDGTDTQRAANYDE